jgi:hypothetical protein
MFVDSTCASAFVDAANEARSAFYSSPFSLVGIFQKSISTIIQSTFVFDNLLQLGNRPHVLYG